MLYIVIYNTTINYILLNCYFNFLLPLSLPFFLISSEAEYLSFFKQYPNKHFM